MAWEWRNDGNSQKVPAELLTSILFYIDSKLELNFKLMRNIELLELSIYQELVDGS